MFANNLKKGISKNPTLEDLRIVPDDKFQRRTSRKIKQSYIFNIITKKKNKRKYIQHKIRLQPTI